MPRKIVNIKGGGLFNFWRLNPEKNKKNYQGLLYTLEHPNIEDTRPWMIEEVKGKKCVRLFKQVPLRHIESIKTHGILIAAAKDGASENFKESMHILDAGKQFFSPTYNGTLLYKDIVDSVLIVVEAPVEVASTWNIVFRGSSEIFVQTNIPAIYLYISQNFIQETECDKFIQILYYDKIKTTREYTELCLVPISKYSGSSQSTINQFTNISDYFKIVYEAIRKNMSHLQNLEESTKKTINEFFKVNDFIQIVYTMEIFQIEIIVEATKLKNYFTLEEHQAYFRLLKYSKLKKGGGRGFAALTVAKLKKKAAEKNLKGYSKMTKAELVNLLRRKRKTN